MGPVPMMNKKKSPEQSEQLSEGSRAARLGIYGIIDPDPFT